jgi:hypothetical protein
VPLLHPGEAAAYKRAFRRHRDTIIARDVWVVSPDGEPYGIPTAEIDLSQAKSFTAYRHRDNAYLDRHALEMLDGSTVFFTHYDVPLTRRRSMNLQEKLAAVRSEIDHHKKLTAKRIVEAIKDFEENTGLTVEDVDLQREPTASQSILMKADLTLS